MSRFSSTRATTRSLGHAALVLAALLAAGRLAQLASVQAPSVVADQPVETAPCDGARGAACQTDPSLSQLYAMCPMAAVVDLQTAVDAPETIIALLPPYRLTSERVPLKPLEPAVPRIRYPVALRPTSQDTLARGDESLGGMAARASLPPTEEREAGEWLIDPREWFTTEERSERKEPEQGDREEPAAPPPAPLFESGPPIVDPQPAAPSSPPPAATSPAAEELFAPPTSPARAEPTATRSTVDPHLELFAKNAYPSARECAACHEDIYHEWSMSAHAYAAVSPMFQKFEQKLNDLSQGTVGYFCMRCHAPVATALGASRAEPLWNLPEVAREGITCIACHRVQYVYGKANGERRIEPGNVFAPVMGGIGGEGVAETIHRRERFKVKTSPDEPGPGQNIHVAGIYFEPLTRSEFCTPCHQVAVHPGIKLEVVWEQYRASPAYQKGIQCQDCHMGRVPGLPRGYDIGPVARMPGGTVNDCRKRANHVFHGPNYSIAHPGIFPQHLKANRWTMDEWLAFDWRAGWGTEEFERRVEQGEINVCFPPVWAEADDRRDARDIIEENLAKLVRKRQLRIEVMENGSHVEGPIFESSPVRGRELRFHYLITNTNEGHNLLTASLGAQPQFWANVVLIGPDGRRLWESGYLDSYGDLANIHSIDVRHKRLPFDAQLFNLQTMFLITGAKGTDREFFVPVNVDIDQLPFIRPGAQPISVINHPPFIRMESQSLAPLGSRRASYRVPGHVIQQPGVYRLSFRMRSRAEPPYFMRFCEATPEMLRAMNEWMIDVHPMAMEFVVP